MTPQPEPVVKPDLPIVDAHIHLWDKAGYDYFAQDFLADAAAGHKVESSVYVECGMGYDPAAAPEFQPVGETRYVLTQAAPGAGTGHALAAAIMGQADLLLGSAVRPVLEAHIEAGQGRFRGIRYRAAFDADPAAAYGAAHGYPDRPILESDALRDAAKVMGGLDLLLEFWVFHPQLRDAARFAEKCPGVTIGLNHCGGPLGVGAYAGKRDAVFADWARGIREIARVPNLRMKLGGLGTSRMGFRFGATGQAQSSDELAAAWRPYILTCIEAFGPDRCYFGSNFPVDRAVASYLVYLNAFKKMLSGLSDGECAAVFADNARRLYKIA